MKTRRTCCFQTCSKSRDIRRPSTVYVGMPAVTEYSPLYMMYGVTALLSLSPVVDVIPSVIEPSFGVGRIMYAILEHSFGVRQGDDQRAWLALPPIVAPISCSVLPLSGNDQFTPFVQRIGGETHTAKPHSVIHSYCHTHILSYTHTTIHSYPYSVIHSAIHSYCHTHILPFTHTRILSFILPFTHTVIPTFCHTRILPFTHTVIPTFSHTIKPLKDVTSLSLQPMV